MNAGSSGNTLNVLANDTDPDGNPLTIVSVGPSSNGGTITINATGSALLYTPGPNVLARTETFSYTIQDSAGSQNSALVTVTVVAPNPGPNTSNPTSDDNEISNTSSRKNGTGSLGWLDWLIFAPCFLLAQQAEPQRKREETERRSRSDCSGI